MQTEIIRCESTISLAATTPQNWLQRGLQPMRLWETQWQVTAWLSPSLELDALSPPVSKASRSTYLRADEAHPRPSPKSLAWKTEVGVNPAPEGFANACFRISTEDSLLKLPSAPCDDLGRLETSPNVSCMLPQQIFAAEEGDAMESYRRELQDRYGRLVAEAAHDIRSPVSTARQIISTILQRIRSTGTLSRAEVELLDLANQRLKLATTWADEILVKNRLKDDEGPAVRKRFHPRQWQRLLRPLLNSLAYQYNVRLLWIGWEQCLPELYVDVNHFSRVLLNLVTNALQASAMGTQVSIRIHSVPELSPKLVIEIDDQGTGLPAELLRTVNVSWQAGHVPANGFGIGLKTARSLTWEMGGTLSAQPKSPRGTTFRMAIPVGDLRTLLRSWLSRYAQRAMHRCQWDEYRCRLYGLKVSRQLDLVAADRVIQQVGSRQDFVFRVAHNRWILVGLGSENAIQSRLTHVENELSEVLDAPVGFQSVLIAKSARFALSTLLTASEPDQRLPGITNFLAEQVERSLGNILPPVDRIDDPLGQTSPGVRSEDAVQAILPSRCTTGKSLERIDLPEKKPRGPRRAVDFRGGGQTEFTKAIRSAAEAWQITQAKLRSGLPS